MGAFIHDFLVWLFLPMSGSHTHEVSGWVSWHGRAMVLSWGFLLPLGVLVARFFKVTPGQNWPHVLDNKRWWRAHLYGQSIALLVALVGVLLVWGRNGGTGVWAQWHGVLGWVVTGSGVAQALSGWARGSKGGPTDASLRGDHFDMTPWRKGFERFHKCLGYLAVAAACVVLALGLVVADAPRWMVLALGVWWLALGSVFALLQHQGRCIDTYQAIWGPNPRLPGNRMAPIGWGISRYDAAEFKQRFMAKNTKKEDIP